MIFPSMSEISLKGVEERGVPNRERILLQVHQDINLVSYGLMVGIRSGAEGSIFPAQDNFLWFGNANVRENDWLAVYTGPGKARSIDMGGGQRAYFLYWGRGRTIFNYPEIVPALFRMDALDISKELLALPQTQK